MLLVISLYFGGITAVFAYQPIFCVKQGQELRIPINPSFFGSSSAYTSEEVQIKQYDKTTPSKDEEIFSIRNEVPSLEFKLYARGYIKDSLKFLEVKQFSGSMVIFKNTSIEDLSLRNLTLLIKRNSEFSERPVYLSDPLTVNLSASEDHCDLELRR